MSDDWNCNDCGYVCSNRDEDPCLDCKYGEHEGKEDNSTTRDYNMPLFGD
ncbi:MAG: hypothetical protein ACTSPK_00215 [Candidatus Heimdallarchaeota archaeon]